MNDELRASYAECRRLTAAHGKTYYFSTAFFPAKVRQAVYALYGFVRYADEIVDNPPEGSSPAEQLAGYRQATLDCLNGRRPDLLVLKAFADTAARHNLPAEYPIAFLDAMAMDLTVARYESFEELCCYTYGSASVVGSMMTCLTGAKMPDALEPAENLGLAMQLTNFWRDMGEDYHQRGRVYLPQDEMRRFGYSDDDLAQGKVNDAFIALMRFQIDRARHYYCLADEGMHYIPAANRLPVRLARLLYSRILDKIEEIDYDVFTHRAATTKAEKFAVAAREVIAAAPQSRLVRREPVG